MDGTNVKCKKKQINNIISRYCLLQIIKIIMDA